MLPTEFLSEAIHRVDGFSGLLYAIDDAHRFEVTAFRPPAVFRFVPLPGLHVVDDRARLW